MGVLYLTNVPKLNETNPAKGAIKSVNTIEKVSILFLNARLKKPVNFNFIRRYKVINNIAKDSKAFETAIIFGVSHKNGRNKATFKELKYVLKIPNKLESSTFGKVYTDPPASI